MLANEEATELSSLRAALREDNLRGGGELQAVLRRQLACFTREQADGVRQEFATGRARREELSEKP